MKKSHFLLYSLIFSFSSLFSLECYNSGSIAYSGGVTDDPTCWVSDTFDYSYADGTMSISSTAECITTDTGITLKAMAYTCNQDYISYNKYLARGVSCQSEPTCTLPEIFDLSTCSCQLPCISTPAPSDPFILISNHTGFQSCEDAKLTLTTHNKVTATCWSDSCYSGPIDEAIVVLYAEPLNICTVDEYTDINGDCQSKAGAYPEEIPTEGDTGELSEGTLPITKESCEQKALTTTKIGIYAPYAWDYATGTCLAVGFKCNVGRVYDATTKTCIVPPDDAEFPDGEDDNNECPLNGWGKRADWDFCNQCEGTIFVWNPPLGLEGFGLECNKRYLEYQCKKDYRMKKFMEVSCGDPLPVDSETNEIDMDNLDDSDLIDQNTSNLAEIDPTNANLSVVEGLTKIENVLLNQIKPILDSQSFKLSSIDGKLSATNSKLDIANSSLSSIDGKISDTNSKLDSIKSSLDGDGLTSVNPDNINVPGQNSDSIDSSIYDNLADNLSDLTSGMTTIQTDFSNTKALLTGQQPVLNISSGGCSNANLVKFGGYISPYSSIFALITYISLMISIFKMILNYVSRGE